MEKPVRIYQCEDSTEGILSAVYEAGISGYGHRFIRIQPQIAGQAEDRELFSEYLFIETDAQKAERVMETVRCKISDRVYADMMYVLASREPDRGDAVYQFITYGFTIGGNVRSALQFPCVKRVFEIKRSVRNEVHYHREFLRFQEIQKEPSLLLAVIEPRHRIIPMITKHFAGRFQSEWFVIYDKTHCEASFHRADGDWEVHILTGGQADRLESLQARGEEYINLWKIFFENIAIAERTNSALQRNMLPLHYRKHMAEFQ